MTMVDHDDHEWPSYLPSTTIPHHPRA
jgi:hypothetical protein